MDKFNLINVFLSVSRAGSFTAASANMGIDPSTVSKSISQLEKHLGVSLFNRTTRRLQLTQAGETYHQTCLHLTKGLQQCEEQLDEEHNLPKGLLRINLPVAYGQLYVMPMIGRFRKLYPDIQLDISLSDEYVDLVGHSVDIAIRSGKLKDSSLVARKLSPMDFITCASPEFIRQHSHISENNIENMPWVNYRFIHTGKLMPLFNVKPTKTVVRTEEINPELVLTTTDGLSMVKAAISGIGLIQAPHFLVRDAILDEKLHPVQNYYRHDDFSIYAFYLNKGYLPAKVRAFLDFLVDELTKIGETNDSTFISNGSTVLPE